MGVINVQHRQPRRHSESEIEMRATVGEQVGCVENALNFEAALRSQQEAMREGNRSRLLLEVNNAIISHLDQNELLRAVSTCLRDVMPHDFTGIALFDPETNQLRAHALDFPRDQSFIPAGFRIPLEGTPAGLAFTSRKPVVIKKLDLGQWACSLRGKVLRKGRPWRPAMGLSLIPEMLRGFLLRGCSRRSQMGSAVDVLCRSFPMTAR